MRDPNLSKETVEILASRLKDKNCLRTGASTTFYRTREKELLPYFSKEEELVYYKNIERPLLKMEVSQDRAQEWRLFINSLKRSLTHICPMIRFRSKIAGCFLLFPKSRARGFS